MPRSSAWDLLHLCRMKTRVHGSPLIFVNLQQRLGQHVYLRSDGVDTGLHQQIAVITPHTQRRGRIIALSIALIRIEILMSSHAVHDVLTAVSIHTDACSEEVVQHFSQFSVCGRTVRQHFPDRAGSMSCCVSECGNVQARERRHLSPWSFPAQTTTEQVNIAASRHSSKFLFCLAHIPPHKLHVYRDQLCTALKGAVQS